ncbi:MAG: hypothetical protein AAF581_10735 [Planctomycetota bacterium]
MHSRLDYVRRCLGARLGIVALLLLSAGCLAPPPKLARDCAYGVVRANHPDTLQRFAVLVEDLYPRVLDAVPAAVPRPCDLWAQNQLRYYRFSRGSAGHHGFTVVDSNPARIHIRADSPFPDWIVAHELVHALLADSWDTLPAIVEEGICDVVACLLCPERAGQIRMRRLTGALGYLGKYYVYYQYDEPFRIDGRSLGLSATHSVKFGIGYEESRWSLNEALALDSLPGTTDSGAEYGLGYVIAARIVERHGLGALLSMCQRASAQQLPLVPAAWLLEAAELPSDLSDWPIDEVIDFGAPELAALAMHKRDELIPLLCRTLTEAVGDESASAKFLAAAPRLTTGSGARISFLEMPHLLRAAMLRQRR